MGTAPYDSPALGWTYDSEREGILSALAALAAVSAVVPQAVPPTASFNYSCTDLDCTFADTSSDDGAIVGRSWDFGEAAATSTDPNAAHTYAAGGDYTVTLTVMDNDGSTDTTEQVITVSSGGNGGGPDCTKKPNHPKCQ